ncbi:polysaccharide biosynthesis protein [Lapidilactobacillus bayanensis]|uniref:polysaccharide biosynthesis protein n=1 Tax=Lapidilactobacillus bayanensis TaxID=2485998 RepID=UPI0013DE00A9|nr:nucleoside-diphosphate sugar epimerase/dehydratase [Lapidilactobacillus bayanensis]
MLKKNYVTNVVFDTIGIIIGHLVMFTYLFRIANVTLPNLFKLRQVLIFLTIYFVMMGLQGFTKKLDSQFTNKDVFAVTLAMIVATAGELAFILMIGSYHHIASLVLFFSMTLLLTLGLRVLSQKLNEYRIAKKGEACEPTRLLVIGSGNAAEMLLTEINKPNNRSKYHICGLVDDNPQVQGGTILGYPILGTTRDIPHLIEQQNIQRLILAIPSLTDLGYHRILENIGQSIPLATIPSMEELANGVLNITKFRPVPIKELLPRPEIELDTVETERLLGGKTILVTGAGGSIGSEICRNLIKFKPKKLLLLGHGENSIYLIHQELAKACGDEVELVPVIADVQDKKRLLEIMFQHQPAIVYHAAAHKHVPMMEGNPKEAVKNNIYGTRNVAEVAKQTNVERFVMLSTDKAVRPTNIMGATKRICEMLITALNEPGKTKFCVVRFGNVLGSRGSVVPLFTKQIQAGGPVTVTDFRMTRYFMTIPEASRLVIHAGTLAKGGEIFILDMGKPVKIYDLAKRMVELSGYNTDEIKIVESGIRPGEKLYEELLVDKERVSQQVFEKIFLGKITRANPDKVLNFLQKVMLSDESIVKESLIDYAVKSAAGQDRQSV